MSHAGDNEADELRHWLELCELLGHQIGTAGDEHFRAAFRVARAHAASAAERYVRAAGTGE